VRSAKRQKNTDNATAAGRRRYIATSRYCDGGDGLTSPGRL